VTARRRLTKEQLKRFEQLIYGHELREERKELMGRVLEAISEKYEKQKRRLNLDELYRYLESASFCYRAQIDGTKYQDQYNARKREQIKIAGQLDKWLRKMSRLNSNWGHVESSGYDMDLEYDSEWTRRAYKELIEKKEKHGLFTPKLPKPQILPSAAKPLDKAAFEAATREFLARPRKKSDSEHFWETIEAMPVCSKIALLLRDPIFNIPDGHFRREKAGKPGFKNAIETAHKMLRYAGVKNAEDRIQLLTATGIIPFRILP
jgi:hypothetical protein